MADCLGRGKYIELAKRLEANLRSDERSSSGLQGCFFRCFVALYPIVHELRHDNVITFADWA